MTSAASSDWGSINHMLGVLPTSVELDTEVADLLMFADANPTPRPPAPRDGRGRYRLPDPETGKLRSWTRATTLAKTISDEWALTLWKLEMAAMGFSRRPDLVEQVALVDATYDKDHKGRVAGQTPKGLISHAVDQASETAGAGLRARMGTALHTLTEHHDLNTGLVIPEPWAAEVECYAALLDALGIVRPDEWIERILLTPQIETAGTADRITTLHPNVNWAGSTPWTKPRIGDLKTGDDLIYSHLEISVQLAIYANATHMWDDETQTLVPMPDVDKDVALVFHLPVDAIRDDLEGPLRCSVYEVDIAAGWELAQTCYDVRAARKKKTYFSKVDPNQGGLIETTAVPTEVVPEPASFDPASPDADLRLFVAELAMLAEHDVEAARAIVVQFEQATMPVAQAPGCDDATFKAEQELAQYQCDLLRAIADEFGPGADVISITSNSNLGESVEPMIVDEPLTVSACKVCDGAIAFNDSPGGSWWSHFEHPADGHDAIDKQAAEPEPVSMMPTADEPFETAAEATVRAACPDEHCGPSGKCSAPFLCRSKTETTKPLSSFADIVGDTLRTFAPAFVPPIAVDVDAIAQAAVDLAAHRAALNVREAQQALVEATTVGPQVDRSTGEVAGPAHVYPNPKPLTILVTGSRAWVDADAIQHRLAAYVADRGPSNVEVVHGDCPNGADRLADVAARKLGVHVSAMPADWDGLGKQAGFRRNEAMVAVLCERRTAGVDVVVEAFSLGSNGTQHTINCARSNGLWVNVLGVEVNAEAPRPPEPDTATAQTAAPVEEPAQVAEAPSAAALPEPEPATDSPPDAQEAPLAAADDPATAERCAWVQQRLSDIQGAKSGPLGVEAVLRLWPAGVPSQPPWLNYHIDTLLPVLDHGETVAGAAFSERDPILEPGGARHATPALDKWLDPRDGKPVREKAPPWVPAITEADDTPATEEEVNRVKSTLAAMSGDHENWVRCWRREAHNGGRPWEAETGQTVRSIALFELAISLAEVLADRGKPRSHPHFDWVRTMLAEVVPATAGKPWDVGAIIGSLSTDEINLVAMLTESARTDKSVRDELVQAHSCRSAPPAVKCACGATVTDTP